MGNTSNKSKRLQMYRPYLYKDNLFQVEKDNKGYYFRYHGIEDQYNSETATRATFSTVIDANIAAKLFINNGHDVLMIDAIPYQNMIGFDDDL